MGEGKPIRITVGASLDRTTLGVFQQLADRAKQAASQVDREMARSMAVQAKAAQAALRDAERTKRAEVTAAERAARELERLSARTAAAKVRDEKQAAREIDTWARQASRERSREDATRHREQVQALREEARETKRVGEIQAREAKATQAQRGRDMGRAVRLGARLGVRAVRFAAGVGRDLAAGYGVDTSFGSIVSKNTQLEEHAVQLSNQAYTPGAAGAAGQRQDPRAMMQTAFRIGTETGTGANEVLGGMEKFTSLTGDLETGQQIMGRLAMLSKATGTNLENMAEAAGNASNQLGEIPDKAVVLDQLMRQIAGQGKLGAVEIKDLAKQMAKVAGFAGQIGGDRARNIQTLGIFAQEARLKGGAASAAIAASSVQALFPALAQESTNRKWGAAGIANPIDKATGMYRDPEEILVDALRKKGMDKTAFQGLFGGSRSGKAVSGFQSIYMQAHNAAGGNEAEKTEVGVKAVREEFDRLRGAAIKETELQESFAAAMGTGKSQAEQFNNQIQDTTLELQSALLPAMKDMAPILVGFAKGVASFFSNKNVIPEVGVGMNAVAKVQTAQDEAIATGQVTETQMNEAKELVKNKRKGVKALRKQAEKRREHAGFTGSMMYGALQFASDAFSGDLSGAEYGLAAIPGGLGVAGVTAHGISQRASKYHEEQSGTAAMESEMATSAEKGLDTLNSSNERIEGLLRDGIMVTVKNAPQGGGAAPADTPGLPEETQ